MFIKTTKSRIVLLFAFLHIEFIFLRTREVYVEWRAVVIKVRETNLFDFRHRTLIDVGRLSNLLINPGEIRRREDCTCSMCKLYG